MGTGLREVDGSAPLGDGKLYAELEAEGLVLGSPSEGEEVDCSIAYPGRRSFFFFSLDWSDTIALRRKA